MKKYIVAWYLLMCSLVVQGQYLSHEPSFIANDMIWNPGSTAERDYLEYGVFYRQQWSGFTNAPRTLMIHGEYPFLYNNFSLGGYLYGERVGIMDFYKVGLNYAYKLPLGLSRSDQLSIGLSATFSKFQINRQAINARESGDQAIVNFGGDGLIPDVDLGVFYISDKRVQQERSYYFIGLSANGLIRGIGLLESETSQASIHRQLHSNVMLMGFCP